MKNYIYILSTCYLLLYSCASSFKMGKYASRYDYNPNTFIFLEDSTFIFESGSPLSVNRRSSGKFNVKGNKIILSSNIQDIDIPVRISYSPCPDSLEGKNKLTFQFKNLELNQDDYKIAPIINNDTLNDNDWFTYLTQDVWSDKWGSLTIDYSNPIDSVKINILRNLFISPPRGYLETRTIYLNNLLGNNIIFDLYINDSLFGYRVFNNEALDIKRGKIVFYDTNEDFKNNLFYNPE